MPKQKTEGFKITQVPENEIHAADCTECGSPFELDRNNNRYALEFEGGEHWLHKNCAIKVAERILLLCKGNFK